MCVLLVEGARLRIAVGHVFSEPARRTRPGHCAASSETWLQLLAFANPRTVNEHTCDSGGPRPTVWPCDHRVAACCIWNGRRPEPSPRPSEQLAGGRPGRPVDPHRAQTTMSNHARQPCRRQVYPHALTETLCFSVLRRAPARWMARVSTRWLRTVSQDHFCAKPP